jgi:STAS domain
LPIDDKRPAGDSPQGIRPITGHHAPLNGFPARVVVCDVSGLAATLDTIDALARLQLNARRRGQRLQLQNVDSALKELIAFIGLRDAVLSCVSSEHPQRTAVEDSLRPAGSGRRPGNLESCR